MSITFTRHPWVGVEARRNCLANPSGLVNSTGYVRITSHGTLTTTPGVDTRLTTTTTGRSAGTTGIILDTLTVGTDLEPNTVYTFSVEVLGDVGGTARSIMVSADGAGLAVPGTNTFSQTVLARREIQFTTGASGDVNVTVANGQATITGTNAVIFRNAIVEKTSTFDGTYFDGSTTSGELELYAWTGTANASASTLSIPDPAADQVTPHNVLAPWSSGRETRTIAHQLLESSAQRGTYREPRPGQGELDLIFTEPDDAAAAVTFFADKREYAVDSSALPEVAKRFLVAEGTLTVKQDDSHPDAVWHVMIPWREFPL